MPAVVFAVVDVNPVAVDEETDVDVAFDTGFVFIEIGDDNDGVTSGTCLDTLVDDCENESDVVEVSRPFVWSHIPRGDVV